MMENDCCVRVNRRAFIKSIGISTTAAAFMPLINSYAASKAEGGKPNILFIMTDDLGWGDVGFTKDLVEDNSGFVRTKTPNMDNFAQKGIRFKQFYSGNCTCSPTRFTSLLGIKSERIGIQYACCGGGGQGIPWGMPTIPKLLAKGGYRTGFIGKWHMGGYDEGSVNKRLKGEKSKFPGPNDNGFDDAYFWDSDCHMGHTRADPSTMFVGNPSSAVCTRYNDEKIGESKPGVNLIENNTDYAMLLMEKYVKESNPFYIQLWYFVPHVPIEKITGYEDGCTGVDEEYIDFCTMVHCLDYNIKRLFDKMEQLGIAENTFVLFTSDNGPQGGTAKPLRGGKWGFKEGGIRMPSFAYWKGTIAGGVTDQACSSPDLLPTFCDLAGVELPPDLVEKGYFDGLSLKNLLLNGESLPSRNLYFKRIGKGGEAIIKDGRWKYRIPKGKTTGSFSDLQSDPYERQSGEVPSDIQKTLKNELKAWVDALPEPQGSDESPCKNPQWWEEMYPDNIFVSTANAKARINNSYDVRISDSRFSQTTWIEFFNPVSQRVAVDILNFRGRKLHTVADANLGAGTHKLEFNKIGVTGTYLARFRIGRKVINKRFSVMR